MKVKHQNETQINTNWLWLSEYKLTLCNEIWPDLKDFLKSNLSDILKQKIDEYLDIIKKINELLDEEKKLDLSSPQKIDEFCKDYEDDYTPKLDEGEISILNNLIGETAPFLSGFSTIIE